MRGFFLLTALRKLARSEESMIDASRWLEWILYQMVSCVHVPVPMCPGDK